MLYTKAMLDGVSSIIFASSLGIGVILSSLYVFIYQGGITMTCDFNNTFLTDLVIAEMTCVGLLLIIGLALNMLRVHEFKINEFCTSYLYPIILFLIV